MKTIKKIILIILKTLKWALLIFVGLAMVSALYNLSLPKESETVSELSATEKAYIAEFMNLYKKLGNDAWPGWGDMDIPVIVYNEKYAFLIGYPNPPSGWIKMPSEEYRGAEWGIVPEDDFYGETYYRQALTHPGITPENFTVKVGDRWVATMQTKEYSAVAFYNGFKEELPPLLNVIFPYKIFWNFLMGKAENYIGGIAHEAFHAFQGAKVPVWFAECENAGRLTSDYPWDKPENETGWHDEIDLLIEAFHAETDEDAKQLAKHFLAKRGDRRGSANLPDEMVQYERKREWLEGLAKYAELKIGLIACESPGYTSIAEIEEIPGFKNYKSNKAYFNQQIVEVKRTADRSGESRFYYGGMLQAVLLDRLFPDWKMNAFEDPVYLEVLLGDSVQQKSIK